MVAPLQSLNLTASKIFSYRLSTQVMILPEWINDRREKIKSITEEMTDEMYIHSYSAADGGKIGFGSVIVYEDELSNKDLLGCQISNIDDGRSKFEIFDFGYRYNKHDSDYRTSCDPVFQTGEFEEFKTEWADRIEKKQQCINKSDTDEQNKVKKETQHNSTLNDFS